MILAMMCIWWSEGNSVRWVLSFHLYTVWILNSGHLACISGQEAPLLMQDILLVPKTLFPFVFKPLGAFSAEKITGYKQLSSLKDKDFPIIQVTGTAISTSSTE